jgi:hypothetical protein
MLLDDCASARLRTESREVEATALQLAEARHMQSSEAEAQEGPHAAHTRPSSPRAQPSTDPPPLHYPEATSSPGGRNTTNMQASPMQGQNPTTAPNPELDQPQRLFQCSTCKRSFTRADHLTRHVRARKCLHPPSPMSESTTHVSWRQGILDDITGRTDWPVACDPLTPTHHGDTRVLTNMGNNRYKGQTLHLSHLFQGLRTNVCVLNDRSICTCGL